VARTGRALAELSSAAATGELVYELRLAGSLGRSRTVGLLAVGRPLDPAATEALRFNPWTSGEGIVPVGRLNRLRRPPMPAASRAARPGSAAGEEAGAGNRQVLQEQLGQLLGVVLGQPVAGPFQDVEAVGPGDPATGTGRGRRPSAGSPDPHTYRVGTGTRGTAMPNRTAARYQTNAAASAPGRARARA
jgi:hypothetical protein